MASADSESPDETFFNDLSQQLTDGTANEHMNENGESPLRNSGQEDAANKPKRIACVLCRKRKLRCDGARPTCGTCKRLAHDCAYDEVRKKSGPKRGYVKLLEARLQQVETLLKNQETVDQNKDVSRQDSTTAYVVNTIQNGLANVGDKAPRSYSDGISPAPEAFQANGPANGTANTSSGEGDFPWEMIGLGLDEPLPPQDVMDDLYQIYFTKVHPSLPIVHRPRFMAAMNLAPHMRPPVCLRYIMWTLAASITDKYDALQEHFYQRARKYAQTDEMRGHGEATITLAHCQTWILTSTYEFKLMYFPRAWLSAGRGVRLAQMMQLHRLDGIGLDVKQCLPPPKDWTEREERRRTFWLAFCVDRYASIGTGWPMTIDEQDILTNMPASDDAFEKSKPMPTGSLDQAMKPGGVAGLQSFGAIVLTATLFGRNLLHLHRPGPDDRDSDLNGGFWSRHRDLENILLNTSLSLPDHLRLPSGLPDPNVIFANMCLHTSAICLHQAAIFKADKYRLPVNVSNESKVRCVTAAAEIASVMKMISHMDLSAMNPFISFCVYVAARVFVQYLKTRPKDQQMNSSLQFLLQAMQALRRKNPLTESFLVQLDLDLESAGMANVQKPYLQPELRAVAISVPVNTDAVACGPIFELRESQSANAGVNRFGNPASSQAPRSTGNNPAPRFGPFHMANASASVETQHNSFFAPLHSVSVPPHGRENNTSAFTMSDGNEMDVSPDASGDQPSPATTNSLSRGGSTSQSSYSPGQQQDDSHSLPYRRSPKPTSNQMPLPHMTQGTPNSNANFFSTSEDMFSAALYSNPALPLQGDTFSSGFMTGNDWDMSALGAGMTPMSEGGWNQMLENTNLGWDSLGPPHNAAGR